jgi:hypothetical protein
MTEYTHLTIRDELSYDPLTDVRNQLQAMTEERDQMHDIALSNQEGHTAIDAECHDLSAQLAAMTAERDAANEDNDNLSADLVMMMHKRNEYRARALALLKRCQYLRSERDANDGIQDAFGLAMKNSDGWKIRAVAAEARCAALERLLGKYGNHLYDCATEHPRHAEICDCGYDAALSPAPQPAATTHSKVKAISGFNSGDDAPQPDGEKDK